MHNTTWFNIQVMVVTASMAAQYVLPLLARDIFVCAVGIAPSNTHEIAQPALYRTPILVLWGRDLLDFLLRIGFS